MLNIGTTELVLVLIVLLFVVAVPLIIIIGILRKTKQPGNSDEPLKQCPFCAEKIQADAKVCRFCGRDLQV